jgi:tetratricopeptide (TPR) repeat protein
MNANGEGPRKSVRPRISRLVRIAAAPVIALALAACGAGAGAYPRMPAPESLPANSPLLSRTLGRTDAWLRYYVMEGQADSAVALLDDGSRVRPHDELVRHLQLGLVYHYAGKWEASNAAFEWAETEAEQRWTRSLTQQAGQLIVNDAVVDYVPAAGEMALIPYYRMLNYLALGSTDGALVEARKASEWLARISDRKDPCVGDGFVHFLAGLTFRGAGERSDALVSYRNAERSFAACGGKDGAAAPDWLGAELYRAAVDAGVRDVADSAAARYRLATFARRPDPQTGDLVLFVENGWVAHRASADVHVPIFPADVDGVDRDDDGQVLAAATRVVANLVGNLQEQAYWGQALDDRPDFQLAAAADGAYVMKLAWPESRLEASDAPRVRVVVDSVAVDAPVVEDVSAVMFRRWQSQRPGVFTRMVARAMVKYMAAHKLETSTRDKHGETAGWIAGRLANVAANALERADTRSWTLLPDHISVARFTLPAGEHAVRLEVLDESGAVEQTVDLGRITLQPRGTLVLNHRVWGMEMGDVRRLYTRYAAAPVAADGR